MRPSTLIFFFFNYYYCKTKFVCLFVVDENNEWKMHLSTDCCTYTHVAHAICCLRKGGGLFNAQQHGVSRYTPTRVAQHPYMCNNL